MNTLKALLFLTGILFTFQSEAQVFPDNSSPYTTINPPATPPLPDYQGSVIDESVPSNISIRRISELYVEPGTGWTWNPDTEYAKFQTWNADQTMYKFRSILAYDATSHELVKTMPAGQIYPTSWSNVDPDLIYGFRLNGEIRTYSIANSNNGNATDYPTILTVQYDANTPFQYVKLGPGEGNIDKNDKYVALAAKKGPDLFVVVCDLQEKVVKFKTEIKGAWAEEPNNENSPKYIDWVSISQSGDYIGIMWNHNTTSANNPFQFAINGDQDHLDHYGIEIYSAADMSYLRRLNDYGNHGDFGYASNGKEVFVQSVGTYTWQTMNMYYLNGDGQVVLSNNTDFNGAGHVSCRNLLRPGWAYLCQSLTDKSAQMFALKLDSDSSNDQNVVETVEHFGHHFSSAANPPLTVVSPKGDKVMFRSDWGGTAPDNDILIFEATAAAALPVELVTFTGKDDGAQHVLSWQTASEFNTDYFNIEHSSDINNWATIGHVEATHNSFDEQKYFFKYGDFKATNFYRLKTIDFDGSFEYSSIISLAGKKVKNSFVSPNPATDRIQLKNTKGKTPIQIFSAKGVLTFDGIYDGQFIDISAFPSGTYFIKHGGTVETFIKL